IEKLSGMSLEEYMEKNIFKPLDMKNTGACFSKGKIRLSAKGYTGYLDVKPADDTMTFKAATGDGFLFSTVEDLYKWDRALYTDKLVSKKTMDLIFTPYAHTFMGEYGYGWYVKGDGKDKLVFHDGITAGFHSNISRYIGRNEGVIILSNNNMGGSGVYKIDNDINSILQGKEVELPKPKKAVKLEESEIQNIVGMYEIMHGTDILITRDGEHIYAQLTGAEKVEIFSEGNNEFFSRVVDSTITIIKNSSGEAVSLVAHQNGSDYYAIKQ
ncbi:MAG: serine hydrolase domain-containing protein, partial [Bacillota bacterium]|nr:serine hydrolase domain-containing protein [Bacillota bacterium]